ncbi:MAG: hypothetical protein HC877_12130 [Thioploca sp.]|nr:hypothetical protein [Thioploca sp.]
MNYRNVILLATVLLITLVIGFRWFSSESTKAVLIVYLRCDGKVSGVLSATTISKNGKPRGGESFDLGTSCQLGNIKFNGYQSEESIRFMFERNNNEIVEIITEYGRDIQRDQEGFYTVLKITNVPPFISNDRI